MTLFLLSENKSVAGVLVPPKGFEYKYDPQAPNPIDKTEEGNEELEKKPKKIYYYPPDLFKNYYQNKNNTNPITNDKIDNNVQNTETDYHNLNKQNNTSYTSNSMNLMTILLIISFLSIIALILGIFYINYLKQKELTNTIPVYMKYPETKLKKRRTVFDVKK